MDTQSDPQPSPSGSRCRPRRKECNQPKTSQTAQERVQRLRQARLQHLPDVLRQDSRRSPRQKKERRQGRRVALCLVGAPTLRSKVGFWSASGCAGWTIRTLAAFESPCVFLITYK
jgi:hypothetical protein